MAVAPAFVSEPRSPLPDGWNETTIGQEAVKVGSGITPTGGTRVYKRTGRPFVRSQNVGWGSLLLDDIAFIDEATHRSFEGTELRTGDVLLNITGASIGRSAVADAQIAGGNVNQHVCIIRPGPRLDPGYLNAYLLSDAGQRQVAELQGGGNRQGLNFRQIRSFVIPRPPMPEQTAIAEWLNSGEALVASIGRLITKKSELRAAARQGLLTGRVRLPGFRAEWKGVSFGELAQPRRERIDPRRSGRQEFCIELEHLEQATGRLLGSAKLAEDASLKGVFRPGDVLFGKLRSYLRKYWLADRPGVCSTEIWPLTANAEATTPSFLLQTVKTDGFVEAACQAYGTHMPRADWNVVRAYRLRVPSLPEQREIAAVLSDMDTEIEALRARLAKTRDLKQAMAQELLSGRTRLV
jgi:type I restriction enzyme S subunit